MTVMTPERLAEILERAEAATPGPWRIDGRRVVYERDGWSEMVTPILHVSADATFIAHARTDVPELVAEIERLRELYSAMTPTTLLKTVV